MTNAKFLMTNQIPMTNNKESKYNLEERTAKFGENVINFTNKIPKNATTFSLISQIVRSGTSIGANYCEADDAESKKDFIHKIGICKKEARETMHWFRMIATATPEIKAETRTLWQEAKELNLIFNAIVRSSRNGRINKND